MCSEYELARLLSYEASDEELIEFYKVKYQSEKTPELENWALWCYVTDHRINGIPWIIDDMKPYHRNKWSGMSAIERERFLSKMGMESGKAKESIGLGPLLLTHSDVSGASF